MANSIWFDGCGDQTQEMTAFLATNALSSIDTTTFHQTNGGAGAAYKCARGAGNASTFVLPPSGILANAGRRITFWVRLSGTAAVADAMFGIQTAGGAACEYINLTTANKLQLTNGGSTGTTVLASNTWYRITFSYTITSTTVNSFKVYINGTLEITNTNLTLPNLAGAGRMFMAGGLAATTWGANFNTWFDDLYLDDGTDLADPGDIRSTAKLPASNNVNNFNTAIGNNPANRWQNVNERPLSIANGWEDTQVAGGIRENYGIQANNAGDVDISIYTQIAFMGWIWSKEGSVAGSPKITVNGVDTAKTQTTSAALYNVITDSATYPSNAATIGMVSGTSVSGTFLYECGIQIAFLVPAPVAGAYLDGQDEPTLEQGLAIRPLIVPY